MSYVVLAGHGIRPGHDLHRLCSAHVTSDEIHHSILGAMTLSGGCHWPQQMLLMPLEMLTAGFQVMVRHGSTNTKSGTARMAAECQEISAMLGWNAHMGSNLEYLQRFGCLEISWVQECAKLLRLPISGQLSCWSEFYFYIFCRKPEENSVSCDYDVHLPPSGKSWYCHMISHDTFPLHMHQQCPRTCQHVKCVHYVRKEHERVKCSTNGIKITNHIQYLPTTLKRTTNQQQQLLLYYHCHSHCYDDYFTTTPPQPALTSITSNPVF